MKNLAKLLGTVAGGLGAVFGLGLLFSGCEDDEKKDDIVVYYGPAPVQSAEECCQSLHNDGAIQQSEFDECVAAYKQKNVCEPGALFPTVYGPAVDMAKLSECCGTDTNHEKYDESYSDFISDQICGKPVQDNSDAENCCKVLKDNSSIPADKFDECVEDYNKNKVCGADKYIPNVYGPAIPPALIAACCGQDDSVEGYNDCLGDVMDGVCDNPLPGSDKAIEECCGEQSEDESYQACVQDYKKTGSCADPDEPLPTYYGPPVEPREDA